MAKTFKLPALGLKPLVITSAAVLSALAGSSAHADGARPTSYRFTTILDSQRDGLEASRCPAINSFGLVAVQARDLALGFNKLLTKRGANDAPTVIADTRQVPDFPTLCDNGIRSIASNPSLNEKGEVAFQGNLRQLSTRGECETGEQDKIREGVFLASNGPLATIIHTINGPGGDVLSQLLVGDMSVNTAGQVAYVPELDPNFDEGVFIGTRSQPMAARYLRGVPAGGFTFEGTSSRVSLNEVGQIAFRDNLFGSPIQGIFLSNPDSTFATVVDTSTSFTFVSEPSLNIWGHVAFRGDRRDAQNRGVEGIYLSRGGAVTTLAESNPDPQAPGPVFAFFNFPSLNDRGEIAFLASIIKDRSDFFLTQGIFTGPDPVANKVLAVGDTYEGVPVTGVFTCNEALNNRGEIAMTVVSDNPETLETRTFVVKATPTH